MHWLKKLGPRVRFKEPLKAHTTLGVGGPADAWVEPQDLTELKEVVCCSRQEEIPYFLIGRGSNILSSDSGFRGVVICLNAPAFTQVKVLGTRLFSGAGTALNELIQVSAKRGLGGLEFLAGIPASCAGALIMNAGSRQRGIGELVESVSVMNAEGLVRQLKGRQLRFTYRNSNLDKYIVLAAVLKLEKRNLQKIKEDIEATLLQKRKTQDLTSKSAGCIFKNPQHYLTCAQMITACGLKKKCRGGAQISGKHANYIINRNGAKAGDILYLIKLIQRQVKERFGVLLQPEVKILGTLDV